MSADISGRTIPKGNKGGSILCLRLGGGGGGLIGKKFLHSFCRRNKNRA